MVCFQMVQCSHFRKLTFTFRKLQVWEDDFYEQEVYRSFSLSFIYRRKIVDFNGSIYSNQR